jgi:Fibronectin type III domain
MNFRTHHTTEQGESYVTRHAKASFAESNSGQGSRFGSVRRAFAIRGASRDAAGSGTPTYPRAARISIGLLGILFVLALLAATAFADGRIGGPSNFPAFFEPGGVTSLAGVAISKKEGGAVYATDAGTDQRVDQFEADGTFHRAFGWGIVPGTATGTGDVTAGLTGITNVVTTKGSFSTPYFGAGDPISGPGIPANTMIAGVNSSEITLSKPATASGTGVPLTVTAGPGNVPTNEVQELTVRATSGTFTLTFRSPNPGGVSATTTPLNVNAVESKPSAAEVQSALEVLPNVGAGSVSVTEGPASEEGTSPYLITFENRYEDTNVRAIRAEDTGLSGGTPSSEVTVRTAQEGGGAVETCTTSCSSPSGEEGRGEAGQGTGGPEPGGFSGADAIAIDNSETSGSYGDVYVVDQQNFRVEKYSPSGQFLLMFGGEVNKTTGEDVCTSAQLAGGDRCGAGVPGTGPAHFYREEPEGFESWGHEGSNSIAVGPNGTVYVGDYGRIQEFKPNGEFQSAFELGDAEPQFVIALAVDSAGNIYERSAVLNGEGDVKTQIPGVREYSPAHALLQTFDTQAGSEPTHIALDGAGDLFVSDRNSFASDPERSFEFRAFKPSGSLYAVFGSDQVEEPSGLPRAIAVDAEAGRLYASASAPEGTHIAVVDLPTEGPPSVANESVSDIQPTTATLHAVVNPRGFHTEARFEYVDRHSYETEGGFASPNTASTPPADLGSVNKTDPIVAAISNLAPGTAYIFRAVAENSAGETPGVAEPFETLPPVSIRGLTTQTVGPELVTIKFELNPNGQPSTYQLKYGTTTAYNVGKATGTLPISNSFAQKEVTFTNLQPNTEYHYRLIAENGYGTSESEDRVFTTELSSAQERQVEDCPLNGTVHGNASSTLREENNSTALPDCRAYEQVSPPDKNGYGVSTSGAIAFAGADLNELAPSGERALFHSTGAFGGTTELGGFIADYIAHRTPAGWLTEPDLSYVAGADHFSVLWSFSAGLDSWLQLVRPDPPAGTTKSEPSEATFYLHSHSPDGSNSPASPPLLSAEGVAREGYQLEPIAQSADFSRVFIGSNYPLLEGDPRPFEGRGTDRVYEVTGANTPSSALSLVAEVPTQLQGNSCGLNTNNSRSENWASADGRTFLYSQPLFIHVVTNCEVGETPFSLFARVDDGSPIQLSTESPNQCASTSPCHNAPPQTASYDGVSPDGTRVWFTTPRPLIDSDTDNTTDVYLANLENGQLKNLVQASAGDPTVSHPTPGQGAGVQDVLKVSPDGSKVAFVAAGVLTESENDLNESAEAGADNLYMFDASSEETKFVTRLCSGPEKSGSVEDGACPQSLDFESGGIGNNDRILWEGNKPPVQLTPDGRFLLFNSYGRLVPADTDNVVDVYRYDFETGQLIRISFGRRGNDGNGNDDAFPAEIPKNWGREGTVLDGAAEDHIRSISADGTVIIFRSAAPLVSHDTNGGKAASCTFASGEEHPGCDVYEWEQAGHESCTEPSGCISLVSDGVTPQGARAGVVSSSGRDITFATTAGLVPADKDGVPDIYDARTNGGFPYVPPGTRCQTPESCRGAGSEQTLNPNYTTESFVGPGNEPTQLKCAKGKHRVRKHGQVRCVGNRHHHHRHRTRHRNPHSRAANNNSGGRR